MTRSTEYANGFRGISTFPRHWGTPEGRDYEERSHWITRNIATDDGLRRRGLNPVEVRGGKRQSMSARVALANALALELR